MRMIRDDRYKLIYYPVGNRFQLFDLQADPNELHDLSAKASMREVRARLSGLLMQHLYGGDLAWISDGKLVGLPDKAYTPGPIRGLLSQRGWR